MALEYGMEKDFGTLKTHPLGTIGMLEDGRFYRYCLAGNATVGAGKVCGSKVSIPNADMDLVTAAAAIDANVVTVTLGATAATASQYADGLLYVNSTAGPGHVYKIKSNPAADASATLALTMYPGDCVKTALTTSSETGLMESVYKGVLIWPTTPVGTVVGISPTEITASNYFWVQTQGPAACLCDIAFALGEPVRVSDATAGAGEPLDLDGSAEDDLSFGIAS